MGGKTPPADAARCSMPSSRPATTSSTPPTSTATEPQSSVKPWLAHRRDNVIITTEVRFGVTDPAARAWPRNASGPHATQPATSRHRHHRPVPDPRPDPTVPIEDVLETLDELVRAGKVRALGVSTSPRGFSPGPAHPGRRRLGPLHRPPSEVPWSSARSSSSCSALPLHRTPPHAVGPARRRLPTERHTPGGGPRPAAAWPSPRRRRRGAHRRATDRDFRLVEETRVIAAEFHTTSPQIAIASLLRQPGVAHR